MTFAMIVRLPISVAFGTDEEFDLRVRLEREFVAALGGAEAGCCVSGEIDASHLHIRLDCIEDVPLAFTAAKEVLNRAGLLARAVVTLETPCAADADDRDTEVLWPPTTSAVSVA